MDISIHIGDPPPGEPWTYLHVGAPPGVTIDISLFSVTMGISTCRSFSSRCNHIHIYMFVSGCGRGELHWPRWWESDAARTPPPGRHGGPGPGRAGAEQLLPRPPVSSPGQPETERAWQSHLGCGQRSETE